MPMESRFHIGAAARVSAVESGTHFLESAMVRLFCVSTSNGVWEVYALTAAQAISTALELAGAGAKVLRVWREGEW